MMKNTSKYKLRVEVYVKPPRSKSYFMYLSSEKNSILLISLVYFLFACYLYTSVLCVEGPSLISYYVIVYALIFLCIFSFGRIWLFAIVTIFSWCLKLQCIERRFFFTRENVTKRKKRRSRSIFVIFKWLPVIILHETIKQHVSLYKRNF